MGSGRSLPAAGQVAHDNATRTRADGFISSGIDELHVFRVREVQEHPVSLLLLQR
jgi:hypothetical protein